MDKSKEVLRPSVHSAGTITQPQHVHGLYMSLNEKIQKSWTPLNTGMKNLRMFSEKHHQHIDSYNLQSSSYSC